MSGAKQTTLTLPQTVVRNPSKQSEKLHRQDPESDDVRPACPEADYRDVDWNDVPLRAYHSHYGLCNNEECFGAGWQ